MDINEINRMTNDDLVFMVSRLESELKTKNELLGACMELLGEGTKVTTKSGTFVLCSSKPADNQNTIINP